MIVKILGSAGSGFHGVQYNDNKVEKGKGELMLMKNFPSFINENSSAKEVRDYLKSVSKNEKVKKPQFHTVISTKYQEHTKEELTQVAENVMNEMGYGSQPFIVVFHNDTENNHVHIVSTRVDRSTGKKINDSFEKLKAQKALSHTLERIYGVNENEKLKDLLTYKISSLHQLETLLDRNGYRLGKNTNDGNSLTILKNGVIQQSLSGKQIVFETGKNGIRTKQLKAILLKYKDLCSNKVFKVEDTRSQQDMLPHEKQTVDRKPEIEFESELQKKLRDIFGLDIVFHHKKGQMPFGYTVTDHKSKTVHKGSEIIKMNELFDFTSEVLDKKIFESLKDFNISDQVSKQILIEHLKRKNSEVLPKEFMLFETRKRKSKEIFNAVKNDVKEHLSTQDKEDVSIIMSENGKYYIVHSRLHYVAELQAVIGEKQYQNFLKPLLRTENRKETNTVGEIFDDLLFEMKKSSGASKDPAENELKKRRKRKKR